MSTQIPRDRPTDEDEVTPEMIAAGVEELYSFSWQAEAEETAARRIYIAMRKLEPRR